MPRRKTPKSRPREYGIGSVYQRRRDGRWVLAIPLGAGRRPRAYYFATESEARAYQRQLQVDGYREPSRETVEQYFARWVQQRCAINHLAPSTVTSYRIATRAFCRAGLGQLELGKLRPAHVEQALRWLLESGLAPRTVQTRRTIVASALHDAVRLELIRSNPVTATRAPRVTAGSPAAAWDQPTVDRFLEANADDRLITLWWLLLTVGCRAGEARALKWSSLHSTEATLTISSGLDQSGRVERETKTHRSRTVPLAPELVEALRAHRARQLREQLAAGKAWRDSGRIFTDSTGRSLGHGQVSRAFDKAIARAGVQRIRLHDTRHTAATTMLSNGVPFATVAHILGHKNAAITMRIYAHVLPQDLSAAVASMRRTLGGEQRLQAENGT